MVTAADSRPSNRRRGSAGGVRHPLATELVVCALAVVALAGLGALAAWLATGQGVLIGGDVPAYIVQAQALLHGTTLIAPFARADLAGHLLAPASHPAVIETFPGAHGPIGPFEPGLALLLAPFVAVGPLYHAAVAGILVTSAAGLVLVHRLATRLTGLRGTGQVLLGAMLVSPAVLVALWQIYPDLPSGIVIACAALEVALVEKRGATTPAHVAVFVLAVAFLPWLQVKNLAPAAVLVAGYAVVVVRARLPRPLVLGAVAASLASLALLLLYNHRYFGTWLGLPEPPVRLSRTGDEYILGLLFGRDHGLFVQVPFAVLGVLGLCLALGRLPAAVVATAAATGSVLVLNGTYVINAYGGGSYVGRFMWALIPAVVAWSAVVLQRWEATGKGLGLPAAVIGGVWVYLAVPVLAGAHTYLNVLATGTGWDPVAITGWWAGLDRLVPEFDQVGEIFGYPAVGLVFELALGTLAVAAALLFVRRSRRLLLVRTVAALVAVVAVVVVVVAGPQLPPAPEAVTGADVGAPVVATTTAASTVPTLLQRVQPGTYRVTMRYLLAGTAPTGTLMLSCVPSGTGTPNRVTSGLAGGPGTSVVVIRCPVVGSLESQLGAGPGSVLHVDGLVLAKTSL